MKLKRWSLVVSGVVVLTLSPVSGQEAGGPPPIMPAGPGFDGLSVTPAAAQTQSSGTTPGSAGSVDAYTVLEGMINRILELQGEALSSITQATIAAYPAERLKAFREVTTLNGSIEGMLASSSWGDNLARVQMLENPQTTKNWRYLKIYGPDGHLDVIARQQAKIRDFLKKQPGATTTAIGLPPSPTKGDGATTDAPPALGGATGTGNGTVATGTGNGTVATGTGAVATPATGTGAGAGTGAAATGTGAPGEDPVAALNRQIDEVSIKIADPNLTKEQRQALEEQRNALSQRLAELARKSPRSTHPSTAPPVDGHQPAPAAASSTAGAAAGGTPGATSTTGTGAGSAPGNSTGGTGPAAPTGTVALVSNSYGVSPMVLSDAEIRAIMEPLIAKELPIENAKLSQKGMEINKYRQIVGSTGKTTIKSVGRPEYDHYREWLKASPTMKTALNEKAAEIYAQRARAAAPAANPASTSGGTGTNGGATGSGATGSTGSTGGSISANGRPADAPLPPGTTLPNGKLDLPSTSAR